MYTCFRSNAISSQLLRYNMRCRRVSLKIAMKPFSPQVLLQSCKPLTLYCPNERSSNLPSSHVKSFTHQQKTRVFQSAHLVNHRRLCLCYRLLGCFRERRSTMNYVEYGILITRRVRVIGRTMSSLPSADELMTVTRLSQYFQRGCVKVKAITGMKSEVGSLFRSSNLLILIPPTEDQGLSTKKHPWHPLPSSPAAHGGRGRRSTRLHSTPPSPSFSRASPRSCTFLYLPQALKLRYLSLIMPWAESYRESRE